MTTIKFVGTTHLLEPRVWKRVKATGSVIFVPQWANWLAIDLTEYAPETPWLFKDKPYNSPDLDPDVITDFTVDTNTAYVLNASSLVNVIGLVFSNEVLEPFELEDMEQDND